MGRLDLRIFIFMVSNRLTLAALAFGCVAAAGVGSYVATRHNAADAPLSAAAAPAPTTAKEAEAVPAPETSGAPAPSVVPTPAKRDEAPEARVKSRTPQNATT